MFKSIIIIHSLPLSINNQIMSSNRDALLFVIHCTPTIFSKDFGQNSEQEQEQEERCSIFNSVRLALPDFSSRWLFIGENCGVVGFVRMHARLPWNAARMPILWSASLQDFSGSLPNGGKAANARCSQSKTLPSESIGQGS